MTSLYFVRFDGVWVEETLCVEDPEADEPFGGMSSLAALA